jgi:hypothetical protein
MYQMKPLLIVSSWLGIAVYCILATVAGPSGIFATRKAQEAVGHMGMNIVALQSLNTAFTVEWKAMADLPESTALEARSLGYLAVDEVAIRLSVPEAEPKPASPGDRLVYEPVAVIGEAAIKEMAGLAIMLSLAVGMVLRQWKPAVTGHQREILVQEASRT